MQAVTTTIIDTKRFVQLSRAIKFDLQRLLKSTKTWQIPLTITNNRIHNAYCCMLGIEEEIQTFAEFITGSQHLRSARGKCWEKV